MNKLLNQVFAVAKCERFINLISRFAAVLLLEVCNFVVSATFTLLFLS
ncbi:MAG: hypothetical protein M9898_13030 [Chitinophagaceae bacterium]|nr:hypothetical protein [Chitinophagaceae bacterium]